VGGTTGNPSVTPRA